MLKIDQSIYCEPRVSLFIKLRTFFISTKVRQHPKFNFKTSKNSTLRMSVAVYTIRCTCTHKVLCIANLFLVCIFFFLLLSV